MSSEGRGSVGGAKLAVLLLTALAILVADQLTKALVVANLAVGEQMRVIGDLVQIWHVRNAGAAFSLFQGGMLLFIVVSVLSVGMVVYFHRTLRDRGTWLHVVLGVVLGGTLGNFADRLRLGYVTDWLSVGIGELRWPTFNVADSSIVIGIGVLVIVLAFANPDRSEAPA
ncbi:MAG: signal peptidase II [Chloroflexota bacterium]